MWEDRSKPRKIYDLLLINTELNWLEIRLGQMYDHVDYFIILEASMTFQDTPKPLFVQENWSRFEKYHSKMIRHTLNIEGAKFEKTWDRETFSRNAMYDQVIPYLEGPQVAAMGDVILVSDVDEIPRPSTLTALRNCRFPQKLSLHSDMYYYSFQWHSRGDWAHPQATYYNGNDTVLPNDLRGSADSHLYRAAWHCSYCFSTIGEFIKNIKSFSHSELNLDRYKDPQQIMEHVRYGIDLYERQGEDYDRIEDNPDVPDFLKENRENYLFLLDRDPENANFLDL
jgi:beta-1,4-mannosyl-glycoprotein beta-1,4-N-acetylglucosaminyltransferase